MSAGDRIDHHVQDSAEAYLVWQLQLAAERLGVALSNSAVALGDVFSQYVDSRNVRTPFERSDYKRNVDAVLGDLLNAIVETFPGELFEFVDVEKEYRDLKKKGDLEIRFRSLPAVSVSVKNYKNGFKRIQLCSGTWNSFLNNFLFVPVGVGSFVNPQSGEVFRGSDRETRDRLITFLGLDPLISIYRFIDETNDSIRAFYADDPEAAFWPNVAERWKADCARYGADAASRLAKALESIEPELVKQRLLVMTGLNFEEELLLLGKGEFLFSLVDDKYRALLSDANDGGTSVRIEAQRQTLKLGLEAKDGREIALVEVPFTLQKNGAWYLPKVRFEGRREHPKEGVELAYGERRPRKSRELATSTNTYLDLGRMGLV